MEVANRYVSIKRHIDGRPSECDFELMTAAMSLQLAPGSGQAIVKNLFLSVDPYQLNRMKTYSSSHKAFYASSRIEPGQRISAAGVGKVVASAKEELKEGDVVVGLLAWEEYTVVQSDTMLTKIDQNDFPLSYHVSVLGSSGLTAYAGLYGVCKPRSGEKVFVTAASGSVGILVGQYAKLSGCYVVGCAGSQRKVDLLVERLGFDAAFNYKEEPDLKSALKRYFPNGIDICFDNVGSSVLAAAVANMNNFGRVAACGAIAEYTVADQPAAPNLIDIIYKRITIRGFLAMDHLDLYEEFVSSTGDHLRRGRMQSIEDISVGIEALPSAFVGLFRGDNVGKKLVKCGIDF